MHNGVIIQIVESYIEDLPAMLKKRERPPRVNNILSLIALLSQQITLMVHP